MRAAFPWELERVPERADACDARVIGLDAFQMVVNLFLVLGLAVTADEDFQCDILMASN